MAFQIPVGDPQDSRRFDILIADRKALWVGRDDIADYLTDRYESAEHDGDLLPAFMWRIHADALDSMDITGELRESLRSEMHQRDCDYLELIVVEADG